MPSLCFSLFPIPLASVHVLFLNCAVLCIAAFLFLNYLSVFGAEWSVLRFFHCSLLPTCLSWAIDRFGSCQIMLASARRGAGGAGGAWSQPAPAQDHSDLCVFNTLIAGADRERMVAMITHPQLSQIWMEGPFIKKKIIFFFFYCLETSFSLGGRHLHACVCACTCRGEDSVRGCGHGWGWLEAPWWGGVINFYWLENGNFF